MISSELCVRFFLKKTNVYSQLGPILTHCFSSPLFIALVCVTHIFDYSNLALAQMASEDAYLTIQDANGVEWANKLKSCMMMTFSATNNQASSSSSSSSTMIMGADESSNTCGVDERTWLQQAG